MPVSKKPRKKTAKSKKPEKDNALPPLPDRRGMEGFSALHPDLLRPDALTQPGEHTQFIADAVDAAVLTDDRTAPFRRDNALDRNLISVENATVTAKSAPDPVQGVKHRSMHGIVRAKLQDRKQLWQNPSVMIGIGAAHHVVDLPFECAFRPMFPDDRHKLLAAGHRKITSQTRPSGEATETPAISNSSRSLP